MNLDCFITIQSSVMARVVGNETVLLELASGTYFGLDSVGTRAWQLMSEGKTLKEIRDKLLDQYDVQGDELEHDLLRLAQELEAQGLVQTTPVA